MGWKGVPTFRGRGGGGGGEITALESPVLARDLALASWTLWFPSVSFFVKQIDYKSQQIQIYHPNNCLASQLLALGNSSTSPFRFISPYYGGETSYSNVSFFSCASSSSYSCPILQLDSSSFIIDPGILSCTKVRDVLSVQWRFTDDDETSLFLGWSNPNCGQCEAQGKKCRLKSDGTKEEIECFVCKTNKISTSTLVLIVAGMKNPYVLLTT
ncbi:putative RING-H2 finger protein ATL21A [Arachis ipaensis]|uniref:putative RING-H2 finger protein ATL21A n=1 Tax=Arachis ipaensis TaxID=130454 RepID=UPI000A2AFA52|nr:putative RING-H2 finger protein ATL21A [Arachis ipaensis]